MIISHKHKFIYIKTFKTASSSMESFLTSFCGPDDIITETFPAARKHRAVQAQNFRVTDHPKLPKRPLWRKLIGKPERYYHQSVGYWDHMPGWQARQYIGEDIWNSYFKFSFERNPWDRQVSFFKFKHRNKDELSSFENSFKRKDKWFVDNYGLYSQAGDVAVDFLGRYENLAEDFATVLERIGLDSIQELPFVNVGEAEKNPKAYRDYYNKHTRKFVEEWYSPEIELFGYEF